MQRDVVDITDRCRRCGQAVAWLVHFQDLTESGDVYREIRRETAEHGRKDCERMEALTREQWPTLF